MCRPYKRNGLPAALPFGRMKESASSRYSSTISRPRRNSLLFVGHVGVLLTAEDGTLYFVEKVAFQEPYRMLRFADRTALSDYLMGKYDTSWGQDTASPFIMENDELMDGWRPNPDSGSSALG